MGKESIKLVANNKKAYYDYFIDEKYEAGIELFGTEVKSIRMGKCSVKEAFVKIDKGEVYVLSLIHISGGWWTVSPSAPLRTDLRKKTGMVGKCSQNSWETASSWWGTICS